MSWVLAFQRFTNDTIRQLQLFMACRQLGIILSSIVLAWLLPVHRVGVIEMLMFTGYLMTFFWSDAFLRGYLANRDLHEDKNARSSFFMLIFLSGAVAMLTLLVGRHLLIPLLASRPQLEGLELYAFYQILVLPLWIAPYLGLLRGQNILLASLFVLIGPSFACWTGLSAIPDLQGALLGLFCYALVGFVWVLTKTNFKSEIRLARIVHIIWPAAWPLILYALSGGLARSFDAWLVARNFDESVFAVFRYGAREFPLVVALSAGLSIAMIPKLHHSSSLHELKLRSSRLMHTCYPIVALLMISSPFLFEMIYGESYLAGAAIFNIYLLLALTQLVFPQSIITARGDTKALWFVSLGELAVNIGISIILLQWIGLAGIAWGTLIAFIFEKIILLTYVRKKYGIEWKEIFDIRIWMIYAIILSVIFIFSKWGFGI